MKKILVALTLALTFIFASTSQTASAQAFAGKGSKTLMFGLGGSYYFGFGNSYFNGGFLGAYRGHYGLAAPIISMDFGVHQYVSVGFWIAPNHDFGGFYSGGYYALAIPGMVRGDFHFYQLIDDKSSSNLHADQLDIYAGLSIGGGPGFVLRPSGYNGVYGVFGVGPQVGIRWYPGAGNVGIYAEASPYIGKSFLEVGCAIKL